MITKIIYGPPDWIAEHTTARIRMAFGFWTLVACVIGSIFFGNKVWWIAVLSIVALIPNVSSETPVEIEE